MQENTTIRTIELRQRSLRVAYMLLAIAALTSCDEQPSPNTSTTLAGDDSAAAYAALSAALGECDDANEACLEEAGTDANARAACASQAETCRSQAQPMEQDAEHKLDREARRCHKICSDDDAGPGGVDDADGGSGDMDGCIGEHAPRLPQCLKDLAVCLNDAGAFRRQAERGAIGACVGEAHSCIKDALEELRARKQRWHNRAGASAPAAGGGGEATAGAGSGGAGSGGAGSGGAGSGAVDPAAGGSSAAGSGGAEAAGAGGSDPDGRPRRHHHKHFFWSFWKH